ncbi:10770_t:CDS:2, partial [Racocetra fulgida]
MEDILEAHGTLFETLTDQHAFVLYLLTLQQSRPHDKLCAIIFLDAALEYNENSSLCTPALSKITIENLKTWNKSRVPRSLELIKQDLELVLPIHLIGMENGDKEDQSSLSNENIADDLLEFETEKGIVKDPTSLTFSINGEDHTLGNALRYVITLNSPEVEYCGYSIPHPSEDKLNIRIQTT